MVQRECPTCGGSGDYWSGLHLIICPNPDCECGVITVDERESNEARVARLDRYYD